MVRTTPVRTTKENRRRTRENRRARGQIKGRSSATPSSLFKCSVTRPLWPQGKVRNSCQPCLSSSWLILTLADHDLSVNNLFSVKGWLGVILLWNPSFINGNYRQDRPCYWRWVRHRGNDRHDARPERRKSIYYVSQGEATERSWW